MAERLLTLRELNRATLARQFLLERVEMAPLDMLARLMGMQAQVHNAPYIGLWTRLRSFQRAELTRLLELRQVVKAPLMRSTLHLMTTDDFVALRLALQPAMIAQKLQPFFDARTNGIDREQFTILLREYLREQPRTSNELHTRFGEFFPGLGSGYMKDAIRAHIPLVQVFPSGAWGFTGKPAHSEAATWLGERALAPAESGQRPLLLRYLAAFGPASVQDMQTWSGLPRLQEVVNALRPELLTFRDERGRELFDLPNAPRPKGESPAPVRFLPDFDNLLFSHANRRRVITDEYRTVMGNIRVSSAFLVDGFVRGIWQIKATRATTTLLLKPFEPLTVQDRQDLLVEGEQLMRWISGVADSYEIQFN